jgi:hypothetical protein
MILNFNSSRRAAYDVTLVGYGRYAGLHVGPKYAKPGYPWQMAAAVDPALTAAHFHSTVLGQRHPNLPLHASFDEWYTRYFSLLTPAQRRRQVVEIALRPEHVCAAAMRYIEAGVKQLILPKPVVVDRTQLERLSAAVAQHEVKAAVASQWHYSDIPTLLRREISRLAGQPDVDLTQLKLHKVEMEFSKENGMAISTTPPLSEMPHVVQLLSAIGFIDLEQHIPEVNGNDTRVDVIYRPRNIAEGIHLRSDLNWYPAQMVKAHYPNWDVQKRVLKVYLSDAPNEPALEVDFWIKFDRSGDVALKPGKLTLLERGQNGQATRLTREFVDDQLLNMNRKIYAAFRQDFAQFQRDPDNLSLTRYGVVGRQLMTIERAWRRIVHPVESASFNIRETYSPMRKVRLG